MSWNDYVNAYLINNTDSNSGKVIQNACDHAAIVGNTDGVVWASSPGFSLGSYSESVEDENGHSSKVNIDQFANLLQAFNNNGVCSNIGGIRIQQEKYFAVSFDSDRNVMYLKKNGGGACVGKSGLAFVIGTYNVGKKAIRDGVEAPQNPGYCNLCCESLVDFLVSNNL